MPTDPPAPPPDTSSSIDGGGSVWERTQPTPDFQRLRRAFRSFAFPMTAAFLIWYLLYVLLADYAKGFMSHKLFGNVNVALVLGLLQFVSTFGIAWFYARRATVHLDPLAERLREEIEGDGLNLSKDGVR